MKYRIAVVVLLTLLATQTVRASILASATWTDQQINPTTYEYTINLHNTGTTNIGTFWFSWVPGFDFMPVTPVSVSSPTGWSDVITNEGGAGDGFAIEWTSPVATALKSGQSLNTFQFESHMTPAQFDGLSSFHPTFPVGTSFVYTGAALISPGTSFVVPEPSSLLLALMGGAGLWMFARRRGRAGRQA